ncbi:hypothetical protein D3C85_1779420 [compost metagenome]
MQLGEEAQQATEDVRFRLGDDRKLHLAGLELGGARVPVVFAGGGGGLQAEHGGFLGRDADSFPAFWRIFLPE